MSKYDQSPLWAHISETQLTEEAALNMANFKSGAVNYKLAHWDPRVNGVRFLKTLIYNMAAGLSTDNWARLRRIRNRGVGNPITVTYDGEPVCMDYLLAVLELEFISANLDMDGLSVLEIGAGYGRTCHAIVSNHDISAYYVIDLDNTLLLARQYLATVLTGEQFEKIHFIRTADIGTALEGVRFDLVVNINSFAEMNASTVRQYLDLIAGKGRYFYTRNPVGKYLDKSLDGHSQGSNIVAMALSTGPLLDIIDIHDSRQVEAQARQYIPAYMPGNGWKCAADGWARPWSYYWQALYRKE